ncbi:FAD-dependent tricarballylate dehydrogenase TcuA [Ferroplasma acidiphilum]|uniref:FAD-dependent tricarballylate dehydrogenase TcuA n=1 Tax=Ferroplasma acidiphilum TaxID=74969 RepID=UPI00281518EA|nr:FAD-dependent tricarballylate dehydrogenase TcuA [Ferroplasma acidiphilum]WMT53529.1 MAG: FAD-dependent tricarballylate dehydrogenase TcuA [Ferroplasma acidiphilum]
MGPHYNVIVIGGGNAGISAAISAAEHGKTVLMIQNSNESFRGGNTRYTRDIRYMHEEDKYSSDVYSFDEFFADLKGVSGNSLNKDMVSFILTNSVDIPEWMEQHGIILRSNIRGTLNLTRTNVFFMGGGKSLINTYYGYAQKLGVKIAYNMNVIDFIINNNRIHSIKVMAGNIIEELVADNFIVCSGGFEANITWLSEIWGDAANNFKIRGNSSNTGNPLKALINAGVEIVGEPKGGHMVAVDARSPLTDGGIVTRTDAIPYGIVVNKYGYRFYDEGEDIWPKRYAIWGHLVADQPGQIAYVIIDSSMIGNFLPPIYQPISANTLESLAEMLKIDKNNFVETVKEYNKAANADFINNDLFSSANHLTKIPKSHFYRPIINPPFIAIPVSPGITFTYMGVKINKQCNIIMKDGPLENGYAAGEIVSGNILRSGYLAGFGLTIGTVTGRIAGNEVR